MNQSVETVRSQLGALLPRLRRFARAITRNVHDADDLVQIGIERALTRAEQWQPDSRLESWMFGIIRNAWIDEVRSRTRRNKLFVAEELGESVGVDAMEAQAQIMAVQEAMSHLPEEQRTAVALVLVEGLSYKEAADVMSIPIGTLTSRLARGRESLQKMLGNTGETSSGAPQ
ncbi:MAG: sigma-70 family RNA polymerase sigma factor [Candidatus Obscuribacterales bacterium]|nr:sigma-70 family RNA polymerase sigma factor [Steroidobacteraceae bacterium]